MKTEKSYDYKMVCLVKNKKKLKIQKVPFLLVATTLFGEGCIL